jgi:hypothetical protein
MTKMICVQKLLVLQVTKGCQVTAEAMDALQKARFIYFNSGKATFKEKMYPQD